MSSEDKMSDESTDVVTKPVAAGVKRNGFVRADVKLPVQTSRTKVDTSNISDETKAIWDEIKDVEIDIYGLKDQVVNQHARPVMIDPSKCYLEISAGAVLPAIEGSIGNRFNVECVDRWVVVTRK